MFKQLHLNITLAEALVLMPKYQKMLKALLSNKEKLQELANTPLNENCSAVILQKLLEKLGDPGKFLIPCGFSELKCKALADLGASINLMPLSIWRKLGLPDLIPTRMTLELANREIFTPDGIARDLFVPVGKFTFLADFVVVDYESDPRVFLILGRPFLRTARALIDIHGEEMILHNGDERLTLNMKHDIASYSNHPHRESVNLINIFNVSSKDCLEEFTDELALITYPLDYDDNLKFDIESDLREIEFLLYQGKDSGLKDSIDQTDLANIYAYFVDPTNEMFNDKHAPDYSFPLRFDVYDDDFLEIESDADNFYGDPFDSKGEKIKESKLLIDQLDLPCDFLPYSEYDSFASQNFSKVDALPSPDNEDRVKERQEKDKIRSKPDKNEKRAFPTVFCLKINNGGAFTPPPKIRYKGGKVNWVDTIDSDVFSIVEVNNIMKELGYEKPSFDYYYKEPKNDFDNGLKKLSSDQDVLQMLKYVEKYKVINLYVDHSVTKETVNVDESLLVNELDNDLFIGNQELGNNDEDVIEDVSEDEWLQNCLRKMGIKKKHAIKNDNVRGQSSRNESMNVEDDRIDGFNSDDGSTSDDNSDSQDSDFLVDPDNMIDDVDVDMDEFRSNIDANVEWVVSKTIVTMEEEEFEEEGVNHDELDSGSDFKYEEMVTRVTVEQRRELHLKKNDKVRVRCICRGKVPQFGYEDGDDDSGSKGVVSSRSGPKKKVKAKKMAQERVEGNNTRQYAQLRDYCLELKNNNSNTTIKIEVEPPEDINSTERKFKRVYVCLGPLKDGFKAGKRDLIGLDGCFLSGSYPGAHCDVLLNNMCEVFNRPLVDGRDKPIITCLEFIRECLMKRIVNVQKVISESDGPLTPNATKVFNIIMKEAGQIKLSTWKDMYRFKVNPCNGPAFWEKSTIPNTIVPLKIHPQIGRPPQKRKKSAAELAKGMVKGNKLSKADKSITCGKCKGIGHNQRKCPNDASA
nr:transposase, mutator type [Tanacetum cinerariifolium]